MPGIESFRRKEPEKPQKLTLSPQECASLLFTALVIDDEPKIAASQHERFMALSGFQQQAFDRQKFIYLAANIAVALTNAAAQQAAFAEVIAYFRLLVTNQMHKRWDDSEATVDTEIEQSAADYARLVFTNPDEERGLSFDWAQTWLRRIGVEEFNPAVLFQFSHNWKLHHINAAKVLSSIQLTSS